MHAIPDKLNALRQGFEASLNRRLNETRSDFESMLRAHAAKAEENAYSRADEQATKQFSELFARMETFVNEPIDKRFQEVAASVQDARTTAKEALDLRTEAMEVNVVALQAEMPGIYVRLQTAAESLRKLEQEKIEVQEALEMHKRATATSTKELEMRHDLAGQQLQEASSKSARELVRIKEAGEAAVKALEAVVNQQAVAAQRQVLSLEEKINERLDALSKQVQQESANVGLEAAAAYETVAVTMKRIEESVEECKSASQTRTAAMERQYRVEIQEAKDEIIKAAAETAEGFARRVHADLVAQVENTRQQVIGEGQVGMRHEAEKMAMMRNWAEASFRELEGNLKDVENTVSGIKALNEAELNQAVSSSQKLLQQQLSDEVLRLRQEADTMTKVNVEANITLAATLRKELGESKSACRSHAEGVGEECQKAIGVATEQLAMILRTEAVAQAEDLHKRINVERQYMLDKLGTEAKSNAKIVEEAGIANKQLLDDAIVEHKASLASSTAEMKARLDTLAGYVREAQQQARELRGEHEAHENSIRVIEQARDQEAKQADAAAEADREKLAGAVALSSLKNWAPRSLAGLDGLLKLGMQARLEAEQKLQNEMVEMKVVTATHYDFFQEEISKAHVAMADLAPRHEVAAGLAASSKVTTELRKQLHEAEVAVNRQRQRLEQGLHDSSDGIEKAVTDLTDLKARMQQETTTLGSEVSKVRAAATSLTHGVLRALQIIGLLNNEIEVVPKDSGRLVPRRFGVEVADLLDWESTGQSLAMRVSQPWKEIELATGADSMLAMVAKKANQQDLRAVDYSLRLLGGTPTQPPPGAVGATPATASADALLSSAAATAAGKRLPASPVLASVSQGGGGATPSGAAVQAPPMPRGPAAAPVRSQYHHQSTLT
eukprot:TRINITY_DN18821_c0_g1_i1.p1 TRINITY_DN18821_c0_g1~~TRINITY_DN18821_c0_g1_i1.p1  ORF type:complete len:899 (-),score=326.24 TRINITY_DN18821_c0_g1_i1:252-2948(-)